jgi:hypothetical protein
MLSVSCVGNSNSILLKNLVHLLEYSKNLATKIYNRHSPKVNVHETADAENMLFGLYRKLILHQLLRIICYLFLFTFILAFDSEGS